MIKNKLFMLYLVQEGAMYNQVLIKRTVMQDIPKNENWASFGKPELKRKIF